MENIGEVHAQRSTSQPPTKVACRLHLKWWRCRRIASTARNGSALAGYYLQKPILYSRDIELALFSDAKLEEPNAVTISLNEAVRAAADRVPTCPAAGLQRKPL
jgi:L-aminopeptidase/D-esterase-like protein